MAETGREYTIKGWRDGEGDPRVEIILTPGPANDPTVNDPDTLTETLRAYVAALPDIESIEVRRIVNDTVDEVVPAP